MHFSGIFTSSIIMGLVLQVVDSFGQPKIQREAVDPTQRFTDSSHDRSEKPRTTPISDQSFWRTRIIRKTCNGKHVTTINISSIRAGAQHELNEENWRTRVQNNLVPDDPSDLAMQHDGNGNFILYWKYPSYDSNKTTQFLVHIAFVTTDHAESVKLPTVQCCLIAQRGENYSVKVKVEVDLPTASGCRFLVQAMDEHDSSHVISRYYPVLPSPAFASGEKLEISQEGTFIKLKLPHIDNDTLHSRVTVIVKVLQSYKCVRSLNKNLRSLLNMPNSEQGWIAVTFEFPETRPAEYLIGKDAIENSSGDCHLSPGETYVVVVIVMDLFQNLVARIESLPIRMIAHGEVETSNLIWLIIPTSLVTCSVLLFLLYRKRQNLYARLRSIPSVNYVNKTLLSPVGIPENRTFDGCLNLAKLKKFEHYVQRAVENGELESQFRRLPKGLRRSCREGAFPKNKPKNRCGKLIPYDETRVILRQGPQNSLSDYINASYIQGYCNERAYIATQGPKSNTVGDFWKMIWQEEVGVICMLVNIIENGESTCEQYWPEVGQTVEYNHIAILNLKQRVYADYTYRSFQLTTCHEITSRKVEHLQYTAWPAKGVPMYSHSIVEYLNDLRAIPLGPGPIVVHCAAGVGRTGTIILCDICLRHMAADATVDLFAEAKKMYNARANMLNNLQQYVLAHLMPTQCLLLLSTNLPCSDVSRQKIQELKKDLKVHMKRLAVSSWKDKALRPSEPLRLPIADHVAKNRFPKFMPVERSLVSLKRYPINDSHSDYISAVSVDGVRVKGQYIASQLPLPSTLSDFWRLVAEKRVQLIVILQRPSPEYFACIDVIPRETTLNPVPYITVENKMSFDSNDYFTTDELLLTDTSEKQQRRQNVTILTCNNWNPEENADPPPPETLVKLWLASERISRTEGPTLVLCQDGVTGCGLYLALSVLLERMAVEQECDVIFAVRAVRRSRPEFVYSKAQFEYLYDAAVNFAEGFKTYANFA